MMIELIDPEIVDAQYLGADGRVELRLREPRANIKFMVELKFSSMAELEKFIEAAGEALKKVKERSTSREG